MIPLLIASITFTAAIAASTVCFLRNLTRPYQRLVIFVDTSELEQSLDRLSKTLHKSSLAFMAFSASVEGLENKALKHWAKTQP